MRLILLLGETAGSLHDALACWRVGNRHTEPSRTDAAAYFLDAEVAAANGAANCFAGAVGQGVSMGKHALISVSALVLVERERVSK